MIKKDYIISRVNGIIVVHNIDYKNLISKINDISESLTSISHRGLVVFDNLTSNGFSKNRFISLEFDGFSFNRKLSTCYIPTMKFIKKCNDFYRNKNLSTSILTNEDIKLLQKEQYNFYEKHADVTLGHLMSKKPASWGLRGDPFLWEDIKNSYKDQILDYYYLEMEIENIYFNLTEHTFDDGDFFFEKYSHGGLSSGMVSSDFWRNKFISIIRDRIKEYYIHNYED